MTVRQTDPLASYRERKAEIDAAVAEALSSGWYINGEQVAAFEREFAAFTGAGHAVGVASGTDALQISLRALGIMPGDHVIAPSHTAVATIAAIELAGAVPVFVDIDAASFTIDPERVAEAAARLAPSGRLKAIIAVHLYGHAAAMPAIVDIARKHQLFVIEDCAQSHGARLEGRATGSFGHVAAYSFYPTKNLGAFGDGGAVTTNDAQLAERLRWLREYGWKERYISHLAGMNSRLDELHAAMLRVKLRHLESDNQRRRAIAALYDRGLQGTGVRAPAVRPGVHHVYHQYVVRTPEREALRQRLQERGVATAIHYPQPVHLQPAYRDRIAHIGGLAQTESACREILSLPMYAQLSAAEAEHVVAAIRG